MACAKRSSTATAVILPVHVMDEEEIDAAHSKPLQAVLDRAHRRVIAVVEENVEGERAHPHSGRRRRPARTRAQQLAHLGGEHEGVALFAAQRRADAVLGETVTVLRRGVEIPESEPPRGDKRRGGILLADRLEEPAERGRAEAKTRHR
jgi:hypothetical protein